MVVKRKVGKMVRPYMYAKYGVAETRSINIKLGDPTVILFKKHKTAYIIYSPLAVETANSVAQLLKEQGYSVSLVNSQRADKLQRWAVKTYSHLCAISHF